MSTSSDEDDELDAAKFASVAIDSSVVIQNASAPVTSLRKSGAARTKSDEDAGTDNDSGLKLYQTRLQDLLYEHLDKIFGDDGGAIPSPPSKEEQIGEGGSTGGLRLFRRAPPGIVVPISEMKICGPRIKPQLRPSLTLDEDSNEQLIRLQTTVVDSETVAEQAKQLREKALASAKFLQAKAELARKKEDEQVAELKRQRGEEWLPSVAIQIAKEIAREPQLPKAPKAAALAIILTPEETNTNVPPKKKKKRKKKVSKQQLGIVID